jgi:hypothetical protein
MKGVVVDNVPQRAVSVCDLGHDLGEEGGNLLDVLLGAVGRTRLYLVHG